jgi:polyisoprenoid-binding protein YceI
MKLIKVAALCLLAYAALLPCAQAQGPVYSVNREASTIQFSVKASVPVAGKFDKWEATLTFPSTKATAGSMFIKIQAASINTGSSFKDARLAGKDFFNASEDPLITFKSNKVVQTSPTTFDVQGTFTIRGVSRQETLKLNVIRRGGGTGTVKGAMAFDRKEYGMDSGIPFIRIADRVEVSLDLTWTRVSGPTLVFEE